MHTLKIGMMFLSNNKQPGKTNLFFFTPPISPTYPAKEKEMKKKKKKQKKNPLQRWYGSIFFFFSF